MFLARPAVAPLHQWLDAEDLACAEALLAFYERRGVDRNATTPVRAALRGSGDLGAAMAAVERAAKRQGVLHEVYDRRHGLPDRVLRVWGYIRRTLIPEHARLTAEAQFDWLYEWVWRTQHRTNGHALGLSRPRSSHQAARLREIAACTALWQERLRRLRRHRDSALPLAHATVRSCQPRAPDELRTSVAIPERCWTSARAFGGAVAA